VVAGASGALRASGYFDMQLIYRRSINIFIIFGQGGPVTGKSLPHFPGKSRLIASRRARRRP